jgi:hypothetical protein
VTKTMTDRLLRSVQKFLPLVVAGALFAFSPVSEAQTEVRRGILPLYRLNAWAAQSNMNLSSGVLSDLQRDPNFSGDFQAIFNAAANLLSGYRIVARGGYFPENAGIPREQQLTTGQGVYRTYTLDDGNFLLLYRTPNEETARYLIRRSGSGFLLPE